MIIFIVLTTAQREVVQVLVRLCSAVFMGFVRLIKCNNVFRAKLEATGTGTSGVAFAILPLPPVAYALPLATLSPSPCHLQHS